MQPKEVAADSPQLINRQEAVSGQDAINKEGGREHGGGWVTALSQIREAEPMKTAGVPKNWRQRSCGKSQQRTNQRTEDRTKPGSGKRAKRSGTKWLEGQGERERNRE